jgi:hypothetical protein
MSFGGSAVLRRLRSCDLGPPAIAFLCATLVLWATASIAGDRFFVASTWARWDSALYMQIAASGLHLVSCPVAYGRGTWCGDAGWYPGYPALLAPLYSIGLPEAATATAVSWLFDFGTLAVLWRGFLAELDSPVRYVGLVFAAFVPGGVYMRAAFPMSMVTFCMILCLLLLRHRRWWWAGVVGGIACFCYLSAIALAPVVALAVFLAGRGQGPLRRVLSACTAGGIVCLGAVAASLLALAQTGHWNAYFMVQAHYGHGFHFPLSILWPMLKGTLTGATGLVRAQDAEATLAAVVAVVLTLGVIARVVKRTATSWDLLLLLLVLICWLAPLTQANLSYWRSDTLLLPGALLVVRLRPAVGTLLTGAAVAIFPILAYFFFVGTLM